MVFKQDAGISDRDPHRRLRRCSNGIYPTETSSCEEVFFLSFIPIDKFETDDADDDAEEADEQDDTPAFQDVLHCSCIERFLHIFSAEHVHLHTKLAGLNIVGNFLHLRYATELVDRRKECVAGK